MSILIESMSKTYFNGFVIRCWREEEDYNSSIAQATKNEIVLNLKSLYGTPSASEPKDIAKHLLKMERMNAVEVLKSGVDDGLVVYKDWP